MRSGIIAVLVGILVLVGIGVAYHVLQAKALKREIMEHPERHVSEGFRQQARHVMQLVEGHKASSIDVREAIRAADHLQANNTDRVTMLVLMEYFASSSLYEGNAAEKKGYRECKAAAQSLIDDQEEPTDQILKPCFTAVHED